MEKATSKTTVSPSTEKKLVSEPIIKEIEENTLISMNNKTKHQNKFHWNDTSRKKIN